MKDKIFIINDDCIWRDESCSNIVSVTNDKDIAIKLLKDYLRVLDERELEIIKYRFGLDNYEELTQKEVAKKYGISRSYVSRIEKRAFIKLLQEFKKARK